MPGHDTGVHRLVRRLLGLHPPAAPSTGVTLRELPLTATASAPDGRVVAAWDVDGVRLCDTETSAVRRLPRPAVTAARGHSSGAVAFAPDGSTVAAALSDGRTIQIWDTGTGASRCELTLPAGGSRLSPLRVSKLVYAPDGRTLAVTGDHLHLVDVASGALRHRVDVAALDAAFAPDGGTIAAAASDQGGVWDVVTGARLHRLAATSGHFGWRIAVSPDGATIVTDGNRVRGWDAATGALRWTGEYGSKPVYAPDGELLAVLDRDSVWLCDPADGRRLRELPGLTGLLVWGGNNQWVTDVAWAPDSRTLAVLHDGGNDAWNNTPQIWDVASGAPLQLLRGHRGRVTSIMYARDGRTITTAAGDATTRIWRVPSATG